LRTIIFFWISFFSVHIQAQKIKNSAVTKSKKEINIELKNIENEAKWKLDRTRRVSSEASIYIDSDVIDYGTIKYGGNGFKTILVYNRGAKPLIIYRCDASCGCTTPFCPTESIPAGESGEIQLEYKNVKIPGSFEKQLTISSNDPQRPKIVLVIKGIVEEPK
jgi:hypothetical protein